MNILPAKISKNKNLLSTDKSLTAVEDNDNSRISDSERSLTISELPVQDRLYSAETNEENDFKNNENRNMLRRRIVSNGENRKEVEKEVEKEAEKNTSLPMEGWEIVFTGKLESLTRREAEIICNNLGGDVSNTLTKSIKILVSASDEIGLEGGRYMQIIFFLVFFTLILVVSNNVNYNFFFSFLFLSC